MICHATGCKTDSAIEKMALMKNKLQAASLPQALLRTTTSL